MKDTRKKSGRGFFGFDADKAKKRKKAYDELQRGMNIFGVAAFCCTPGRIMGLNDDFLHSLYVQKRMLQRTIMGEKVDETHGLAEMTAEQKREDLLLDGARVFLNAKELSRSRKVLKTYALRHLAAAAQRLNAYF